MVDIDATVREEYPSLYWLLGDPQVGPLLRQAVDPNQPFSDTRFQSKLYETKWFKSRSPSMRQWEILQHTDPRAAVQKRQSLGAGLKNFIDSYGLGMNKGEQKWIVESLAKRGIEANSEEFKLEAYEWMKRNVGRVKVGGTVSGVATKISQMANEEYLVNMSRSEGVHWGGALAMGRVNEEGIREKLVWRAMSKYPHLAKRLAAGETMADIAQPLISLAADQLEQSEAAIDMRNPAYAPMLSFRDPRTKELRLMTETEAIYHLRANGRFWKTNKARTEGAEMATTLLKAFGLRRD